MTLFHKWNLVYARMCTQNSVFTEVVSVCWLSTNMILRDKKSIKAVCSFDDRIKVLENFELFIFYF